MQFFCSKCEKPVYTPVEDEVADGYLYSCPECEGPVAFVSYGEAEEYEDREDKEAVYLDDNQRRYLKHILDKQLVKLHNAAHQLMDIKDQIGDTL